MLHLTPGSFWVLLLSKSLTWNYGFFVKLERYLLRRDGRMKVVPDRWGHTTVFSYCSWSVKEQKSRTNKPFSCQMGTMCMLEMELTEEQGTSTLGRGFLSSSRNRLFTDTCKNPRKRNPLIFEEVGTSSTCQKGLCTVWPLNTLSTEETSPGRPITFRFCTYLKLLSYPVPPPLFSSWLDALVYEIVCVGISISFWSVSLESPSLEGCLS